eukprot:GHVL01023748.1.p1 GENE.GHVL01023748.1~~GHVL01023748.1.p1  ORF type:complete len:471 (+),score=52.05 GHVL01023748.1:152-1564(+)
MTEKVKIILGDELNRTVVVFLDGVGHKYDFVSWDLNFVFSRFGPVEKVDTQPRTPTGLIKFYNEVDAVNAINSLNGIRILSDGAVLRVCFAREDRQFLRKIIHNLTSPSPDNMLPKLEINHFQKGIDHFDGSPIERSEPSTVWPSFYGGADSFWPVESPGWQNFEKSTDEKTTSSSCDVDLGYDKDSFVETADPTTSTEALSDVFRSPSVDVDRNCVTSKNDEDVDCAVKVRTPPKISMGCDVISHNSPSSSDTQVYSGHSTFPSFIGKNSPNPTQNSTFSPQANGNTKGNEKGRSGIRRDRFVTPFASTWDNMGSSTGVMWSYNSAPTSCPSVRKYTCKYQIGIEDSEFQVARRIIGSKGSNMKAIVQHSGAKLRLRGRGSGYREGEQRREAPEGLHLCISCTSNNGYTTACHMVEQLLKQVMDDYRRFCLTKKKPCPNLRIQRAEHKLMESRSCGGRRRLSNFASNSS